ncbi:uncharacterized protein LOC143371185 [Andrena cerasifolii]|uniref:uncharacterized protein LOC143371185 n=1 Tax=Andrena cerasifolii TaxID=2819439 RepID=UPI00403847FE
MDLFQTHYRSYYSTLSVIGLWPYDVSIFANIKRLCFCLYLLSGTIIQFALLATSEITSTNVLLVLSCNGPALLFFTQYVGFIINFSSIKVLVETIQSDCSTFQNPVELGMLTTHINTGKRIFMIYLCVSCMAIVFVNIMLLRPIVLDFVIPVNGSRYPMIRDFGFLVQQSTHSDVLSLYVMLAIFIGLLGISCSESKLAISAQYVCGLFKIVRCDSMWYCIPLSQQKLLLFIMQRSSIECTINLSSLCTAHYSGFATVISLLLILQVQVLLKTCVFQMMSSAFSYFTVICSVIHNRAG